MMNEDAGEKERGTYEGPQPVRVVDLGSLATGSMLQGELTFLDEEQARKELTRLTQRSRYVVPGVAWGAFIVACTVFFVWGLTLKSFDSRVAVALTSGTCLLFGLAGGAAVLHFHLRRVADLRIDVENAVSESDRRHSEAASQVQHSTQVEAFIGIAAKNMLAYYKVVKDHASRAYVASLTVAVIGFVIIAAGLAVGWANVDRSMQSVAYMSSAAGILSEMIAALFFYLYNRTVKQLRKYHESLVHVQDTVMAIDIAKDVMDPRERAGIIAEVLRALAEHAKVAHS